MKRISLYSIVGALLLCSACGSVRKQASVTVTPLVTLTADTASMVQLDLNFLISKRTLSTRHRLIVVPQLVCQDSVWAEYPAVAVDAPVYARKLHRRQVLDDYRDSLAGQTVSINHRRDYQLPYRERVAVPRGCVGGKIVGMLSSDGCGECDWVQQVDMAYLSTVPQLLKRPEEAVRPRLLEPVFVVRPKVMSGQGEALLQFHINSNVIDLQLGHNRQEMNGMLNVLGTIVRDTLATLQGVTIDGMASADGSFAFNTHLAASRADAAKRWLVDKLDLSREESRLFRIGSRPEGWEPVLQAMIDDAHPDTAKVAHILRTYAGQNDDVAERYIRRLACWGDIRNNYLQKDRKVLYEYRYTLRSFTSDAELLAMYSRRPDAFNEEELLRVAALKQTNAEKIEVYRTVLRYFPESQVAANNLALLLVRQNRYDEAEQVLLKLPQLNTELTATLAFVYACQQRYELAADLLVGHTAHPEMRYFLGLVRSQQQRWDEAYRLLSGFNDVDAAVVSLCVNDTQTAQRQMMQCSDATPRAAYVRAVIAARQHQKQEMLKHLQQAATDEVLHRRMADDSEFIAYRTEEVFLKIVKGGVNR